jgi:hypothetical protein
VKSGSARWWLLGVATVGFTTAAFVVPWHVATAVTGLAWAGPNALADSVGHALIADWAAAVPVPGGQASSALTDPTRFWRWFHIVKAVLACAALIASSVVVARAWRAGRVASTRGRRFGWAAVAAGGGLVASLAVVLVVANVQGAFAPLSSVLSFLPFSGRSPSLTDAVTALNASIGSSQPTPTAAAIVRDFATYHAVVAVLMALVTVLAAVMTARVARDRRWGSAAAFVATMAILAVLTIANTGTAFAPAPALQSFLSAVA